VLALHAVAAACFDEYDVETALLLAQCFNVTLVESPYVDAEGFL
jgi:hypothetical protein